MPPRPPRRPTRVDTIGSTSVADPTTERALSDVRELLSRVQTKAATANAFTVTEDLEFNDFSATEVHSVGVTNLSAGPGTALRLYGKAGEWYVTDGSNNEIQVTSGGALNISGTSVPHSSYWYSPIFCTATVSSARGPTNNQCRALYMGRAPQTLSSINVRWQQVAGGTITWAEWGIATGTFTPGSAPTLTLRGYVDAATEWASSGRFNLNIPVTGTPIAAGDDIWVCYAVNFSAGSPTIRVGSLSEPLDTFAIVERNTTRISTNLNTPLAFVQDAAGTAWVAFYL